MDHGSWCQATSHLVFSSELVRPFLSPRKFVQLLPQEPRCDRNLNLMLRQLIVILPVIGRGRILLQNAEEIPSSEVLRHLTTWHLPIRSQLSLLSSKSYEKMEISFEHILSEDIFKPHTALFDIFIEIAALTLNETQSLI